MWTGNMVSELHQAQAVPPADAPGVRMLSRQLLSGFFPPSLALPLLACASPKDFGKPTLQPHLLSCSAAVSFHKHLTTSTCTLWPCSSPIRAWTRKDWDLWQVPWGPLTICQPTTYTERATSCA